MQRLTAPASTQYRYLKQADATRIKLGELRKNVDNKVRFHYLDGYWLRLIDAAIYRAALYRRLVGSKF